MKKNILYLAFALLSLSACKKDGLVKYDVEKTFPDQQLNLDVLKTQIAAGSDGFKMILEPAAGGIYGGYMKFDGTSDAKFVVDNNIINAGTPQETKYALKISHTNPVLALGSTGAFANLASTAKIDTNYTFKSLKGDTLNLVGDATGTKLKLIKALKKDGDEYLAGKMAVTIAEMAKVDAFKKYFKRLTFGGKSYDVQVNTIAKKIIFFYANGTEVEIHGAQYYYTGNGLVFKEPFVDGSNVITGLDNVVINTSTSSGTFGLGAIPGTLTNEIAPLIIDKTSANSLTVTVDEQWGSVTGFTKDGVVDYLNIRAITGFSQLIHWVGYDPAYDLIGFTFGTSIRYGPAVMPQVSASGIMVFRSIGVLGTIPTATVDRNKVVSTINNFIDPQGFYVVQDGAGAFDLVAVNGGNLWINYKSLD